MTIDMDYQSNWEEGVAESTAKVNLDTGEVSCITDGEICLSHESGNGELENLIDEEVYHNGHSFTVTANEGETGYDYCVTGSELDKLREICNYKNKKGSTDE